MVGHDGQGWLQQMHDGTQVAGRPGRVIGPACGACPEDHQDAIPIRHDHVGYAIAIEIRHGQILGTLGRSQLQRRAETGKIALTIDEGRQEKHAGRALGRLRDEAAARGDDEVGMAIGPPHGH
jgi:hypothetical protein